jgi:hypothetical protein
MNELTKENQDLKLQNKDLQNILLYYIGNEMDTVFTRSEFIKLVIIILKINLV